VFRSRWLLLSGSKNSTAEIMKDIYKDVTEWLKFAETKNAALLTFNGVLLFGIVRILQSNVSYFTPYTKTFTACIILLIINICINLMSFIPALTQSKKQKLKSSLSNEQVNDLNLLYYGNLKNFNEVKFLEAIIKKYNLPANDQTDEYLKDLSLQIVTLSSIATKKYIFFSISVYITGAVIFLVILKTLFNFIL
jgi:hypothetical protein